MEGLAVQLSADGVRHVGPVGVLRRPGAAPHRLRPAWRKYLTQGKIFVLPPVTWAVLDPDYLPALAEVGHLGHSVHVARLQPQLPRLLVQLGLGVRVMETHLTTKYFQIISNIFSMWILTTTMFPFWFARSMSMNKRSTCLLSPDNSLEICFTCWKMFVHTKNILERKLKVKIRIKIIFNSKFTTYAVWPGKP